MKETFKKIVSWVISPLDNKPDGMSMRKVGSLISILTATKLSLKYTDTKVLSTVISIWLIFALLCLAIITGSQLVMLKNGNSPEETKQ